MEQILDDSKLEVNASNTNCDLLSMKMAKQADLKEADKRMLSKVLSEIISNLARFPHRWKKNENFGTLPR